MKKFTLIAMAFVGCFLLASCTKNPKEAIMKATDAFFAQAETDVKAITNAEDFMKFFNNFEEKKTDFLTELVTKYETDGEGNFLAMSAEENEALYEYMYERASAYNKIEGEKSSEFLTPIVDRFEKAVKALYEKYIAGEDFDDSMIEDIEDAYDELELFADYDNVQPELNQRFQDVQSLLDEMFSEEAE